MKNKWGKCFLAIAVISSVIACIVYLRKGKNCDCNEEFSEEFEDEDFDLDDTLEKPTDRDYVSLTPNASEEL